MSGTEADTLGTELASAREVLPDVAVEVRDGSLIVQPAGPRHALSNAAWNGGMMEGPLALINHHLPAPYHPPHGPPEGDIHAYVRRVVGELGLAFERTIILMTGVRMDNLAVEVGAHGQLTVVALVTAGVETNAMRAGDPAGQAEENGVFLPVGTVNMILLVGAAMAVGVMAQALIVAAEAKAAAFQELGGPSRVSAGIATGTGTDVAAVVCDPGSALWLSYAGGHTKVGELVAATTRRAIRRSLERRAGLRPADRRSALRELGRFGLTRNGLLTLASRRYATVSPDDIGRALDEVAARPVVAAAVTAALHLQDQVAWGTYAETEVGPAVAALCEAIQGSRPDGGAGGNDGSEPGERPPTIPDRIALPLLAAAAKAFGVRSGIR